MFKIFTFFILSTYCFSHDFSNLTFDPPSPGQIDYNQKVTIYFNYETDQENGVRITVNPTSTTHNLDFAHSGSILFATGSGTANTDFVILSGTGVVDGITLQMFDKDFNLIYQEDFPVNYTFPIDPATYNPYPRCTYGRWIPHLTRSGSPFTSTIMVENLSESLQPYQFSAYREDGTKMSTQGGTVEAKKAVYLNPDTLFGTTTISHFEIEPVSTVLVRVIYEGSGVSTPSTVEEICKQGTQWGFVSSDWAQVFDGFAFVNLGTENATITVIQMDENGTEVARKTITSDLGPIAKLLYLPDEDFSTVADARFQIESNQPITLTALAGTRPGSGYSFLWVNPVYVLKP